MSLWHDNVNRALLGDLLLWVPDWCVAVLWLYKLLLLLLLLLLGKAVLILSENNKEGRALCDDITSVLPSITQASTVRAQTNQSVVPLVLSPP
jgi:hypothetical protein